MRRNVAQLLLISALASLGLRCSGAGDLAGASGSGNPSGTVAVAVLAHSRQDSAIFTAGLPRRSAATASRTLPITDAAGMPCTVTSALLKVRSISFILDEGQSIPQQDGRASVENGSVVIQGPFTFDILTGEVRPPLDSIRIPAMSYNGLEVLFWDSDKTDTAEGTANIAITITYRDSSRQRKLKVAFAAPLRNSFGFAQGSLVLDSITPERVLLALDASRWLDGIDISTETSSGALLPDSSGELVISDRDPSPIQKKVKENFIASGKLVRK